MRSWLFRCGYNAITELALFACCFNCGAACSEYIRSSTMDERGLGLAHNKLWLVTDPLFDEVIPWCRAAFPRFCTRAGACAA